MKNTRSVPQGCPYHINLKNLLAIENGIHTQFACFNIFRCNTEESQETQASKLTRKCSICYPNSEIFLMKRAFLFRFACDPGIEGP